MSSLVVVTACAGEAPPNVEDPGVDGGTEMPGEQPTTPLIQSEVHGVFNPLGAFTNIAGRALMVRKLDGKTEVSMALSGGTAGTMYTAHVHIAPCQYQASAVGTGHYMIDPAQLTTIEANELWVKGTAAANGMIVGTATFDHIPRNEAISLVVHDPVMGKMACADFAADETAATIEYTGTLAPFAAAVGADLLITGTLTASKTATATTFNLSLAGLDAAQLYEAHVHNQPCTVITGGTHYMIDPTVPPPAVIANEVWFQVPAASTTATLPVTVNYRARTDAQSVVLHRLETVAEVTTKVKVACADLTRTTAHAPLETTATAQALPAAAGMDLSGTATMKRKFTGVTEVVVAMSGMAADTTYAAHVHNQPCAVEAGGAHYKFDAAATDPANEITFDLAANAEGTASDSAWVAKTATAEAQSIIVHGGDGGRLACFDLQ